MRKLLVDFWQDDQGTEVLEYALLLGLIVVACIGLMGQFGVRVVTRWESLVESI